MRNLDDPQPAAVTGPETLDQDMTPRDIADTLARLRFHDRMRVIAIDREARNYLVASVPERTPLLQDAFSSAKHQNNISDARTSWPWRTTKRRASAAIVSGFTDHRWRQCRRITVDQIQQGAALATG